MSVDVLHGRYVSECAKLVNSSSISIKAPSRGLVGTQVMPGPLQVVASRLLIEVFDFAQDSFWTVYAQDTRALALPMNLPFAPNNRRWQLGFAVSALLDQ